MYFEGVPADAVMPPFNHSGVFDPGFDPFPPSRPATPEAAKADGGALGIQVKPAGNRPVQPVVNKFFYWAPCEQPGKQPGRLLVGEPHADDRTRAPGKDRALLARSFRHQ